jgi:hypothetical protein
VTRTLQRLHFVSLAPAHRWYKALLACGLAASVATAWAQDAPPPGDDRSQAVAHTVFGILSYTRWPSEPQNIRLCVVGPTEYADELIKGGALPGGRKIAVRRMHLDDAALLAECDSVYAGMLADDAWRRLMVRLAGKPLLSISERQELCKIGGMFCLDVRPGGVSFEVNLDSVARSGVRVNPRVLQLAKRKGDP